MARILVVAPDLPHPPFTGAHTRPLSLIRALARGHEVVAVGAAAPGADLAPLEELCLAVGRLRAEPHRRGPARSVLAAARRSLTPVPLIERSNDPTLARLVDDAVRKFQPDAIQVETMYAAHYRRDGVPAVMDLQDVVSGLCDAAAAARPWRYAAARAQAPAARRAERELLAGFSAVLTVNDDDAARVRRLGVAPDTVPLVVPVPVGGKSAPPAEDRAGSGARPLRLLFLGSYAHLPNRAAAAFLSGELAPALARAGVSTTLVIAGRGAAGVVAPGGGTVATQGSGGTARDAAGRAARDAVVTIQSVESPPSVGPLYRAADVAVVPLAFGGGTKNKTLEAMAYGLPVVGSEQAFTGLPASLLGSACVQTPLDGDAMAAALAGLAADPGARARMGAAARAYVLAEHTQDRVDAVVDAVYQRVLA